MAFPTLATLEVLEGYLYVLKKSSTVIGQLSSIQIQSQTTSRKHARVGDINKAITRSPTEHTVNLELYSDHDVADLAAILGGTAKPGSGGWLGSETLKLDPGIAPFNLTVEQYDLNSTTGSLEVTWTLTSFAPNSLNFTVEGDNVVMYSLDGDCTQIAFAPAAGLGA